MSDNTETNQLIKTIKEVFVNSKNDMNELSRNIDKYLIPEELEKKTNAEVSTPYKLRNEMLDKIPVEFWKTPKKVFEPCCGKGGFVVDIVNRFMDGLKDLIPNEEERLRTIVEDCLYFSDINETNIFICEKLLDNNGKGYKLNSNLGNTLELDIKEKWGLDGFDAVIGNPPYNSSGNTGTGNTIWQHFTRKSLEKWLNKNGYLLFVHPPGWRKPCNRKSQLKGLYNLMTKDNFMVYLNINNMNEGMKVFKCGTRFDYYLIKKVNKKLETFVIDENNNELNVKLYNYDWIPNSQIDYILKLLTKNNLDVIMNSSYHATRTYVSTNKNNEYKYPLIHSTPKSGVRYKYSNRNDKGHFDISKIIFGESGINHVIIDMEGKYGMTQGAIAIKVKNLIEAKKIKKALLSNKFKLLLKSSIIGNYRIDANIFRSLDRNFWKEFV
jgi:hypothetical protein